MSENNNYPAKDRALPRSICIALRIACCIWVLMHMTEVAIAQERNPIAYPYGGIQDSSRLTEQFVPLNFHRADFKVVRFGSVAEFKMAHFDSIADFEEAYFDRAADFWAVRLSNKANFRFVRFKSTVNFTGAHFCSTTSFEFSNFNNAAYFEAALFESATNFGFAHFRSQVDFGGASFKGVVNFESARFDSVANFGGVHFDSLILARASIGGKFTVGSKDGQEFNFARTVFLPSARLELHELVELKIQPEKFQYLSLGDTLDYFLKRDIIENLKNRSFTNDKSAQFELEYILSKSTMYQEPSSTYKKNRWYQIWMWPKWIIKTIYYWTMGLGYRPFRLIWWALATIIVYTGVYARKMPNRINAYISNQNSKSHEKTKNDLHLNFGETLLNCTYFSVMIFFTLRLKSDILTFFQEKEKRIILIEWLAGFLVYVAFVTLSKSGSILQNLKDLFVG